MYPDTKPGRDWWLLDDPTERIHGTQPEDENSPYDPDVVDAPEDMKRVGNDHEALHNAKLSPNGYYNGFHHKDFEGKYAQKRNLAQRRSGHHHMRHHQNVQVSQHDNDTDDLVEDVDFLAYDHENDTDDIPADMDPALVQKKGGFQDKLAKDAEWNAYIDEQNKQYDNIDEKTFIQYNHENDTEDIPNDLDAHHTLDPIVLAGRKKGDPYMTQMELAQQKEDIRLDNQAEEIRGIMKEQMKQDSMNIQLSASHIPHEDDTEDIVDSQTPVSYDIHHSKAWNAEVDRKAQELENEMKIEENMKISKKKAAEEAKIRAAQEKAKKEAERKKAQELAQQKQKAKTQSTIDLNELYKDMTSEGYLQTEYNDGIYEHHTPYYNDLVEQQSNALQQQMERVEIEQRNPHLKTVDHNELYDGIALQTGDNIGVRFYEHHSKAYLDAVEEKTQELEDEMHEVEKMQNTHHWKTVDQSELYDSIMMQTDVGVRFDPHHSQYWMNLVDSQAKAIEQQMREVEYNQRHPQPKTIDHSDLYNGMFLQTGYENHSRHYFDIEKEQEKAYDQREEDEAKREKQLKFEMAQAQMQGVPEVKTLQELKHPNPSVDFGEIYDGIAVQLSYSSHDDDTDDVVPEFSEDPAPQAIAQVQKEKKLKDFNGQEYEEVYDE